MNFWRYTFHGAFASLVALASAITVTLSLVFYIIGRTIVCVNLVSAYVLLLLVSVGISYVRWRHYRALRNQRLTRWGTRL